MQAQAQAKTSPLILFVFWAYVGIPLLWGIYSTLTKAVGLFH